MKLDLVDQIYEAAALPEKWPAVLDEVSRYGDGDAGLLFTQVGDDFRVLTSPNARADMDRYVAEGWPARCDRPARLFGRNHAGFLTDLDVYDADEIEREPVYIEFLRKVGLGWGAATAITIPTGARLVVNVERAYAKGPVPVEVVRRLDDIRPHLARAATLSAHIALERARAAASALDAVGLPAALIGRDMKTLVVNERCKGLIGRVFQTGSKISLRDRKANALLQEALAFITAGAGAGRSIPIAGSHEQPPAVIHVLPVRREARDLFTGAVAIVVVTQLGMRPPLDATVIGGLFDLTPAEARVASGISSSQALAEIADAAGTSIETVRAQLKSIFRKTGTARQTELALLLVGTLL